MYSQRKRNIKNNSKAGFIAQKMANNPGNLFKLELSGDLGEEAHQTRAKAAEFFNNSNNVFKGKKATITYVAIISAHEDSFGYVASTADPCTLVLRTPKIILLLR